MNETLCFSNGVTQTSYIMSFIRPVK